MKPCGHTPKQCIPECDDCVLDAMKHRCTSHARREWLTQIHRDDKQRYERLTTALRAAKKKEAERERA
ncbi:hypothetical protein [Chitinibacter tainanensis]|uniref:hypothetical protein n=1 Tax=Chitinibacter tainanensis TaxID=230667 RepID=UPI0023537F67|nr:hypothetical protein [Chitinibacter tainanensis]